MAGASPSKTCGGQAPSDPQGTIRGSVYKASSRVDSDIDRKVDFNPSEQCSLAVVASHDYR